MRGLSICGMFLLWLINPALAADSYINCDKKPVLCTDRYDHLNSYGKYSGHDEPALLFYSNVKGSGNSGIYRLTLPSEPPTPPNQAGTGGTYNFQLHPTFWVGMAMCDNQSAPNPSSTPCTPNSDSNIFKGSDPTASDYIGNHPGTAFMEMQFYPPGWVLWPNNTSCDATKWCAALNIDSFSQNMNTGQFNNGQCRLFIGDEPVNFAFITKDGVPLGPPSPLAATEATFTPTGPTLLLMNPGDEILVTLSDTAQGLKVEIQDLTTGESGSMVASAANGFAQVNFAPTAASCSETLYDFHPMYATSSEDTRVVWAAHSYNIAFSDEIGHFEYCSDASCSTPQDTVDDFFCFPSSQSSLIPVGGCTAADVDFNGVSYQLAWPGTIQAPGQDKKVHPSPVKFSSPKFQPTAGGPPQQYNRVGFETDLPGIEPGCNTVTGANCFNPPQGAQFYPIYTTTTGSPANCRWQLGGANLAPTENTFGGTSFLEYGPLLQLLYPVAGNTAQLFYEDFRQVLASNPCVSK
jgi:hypothetical protein